MIGLSIVIAADYATLLPNSAAMAALANLLRETVWIETGTRLGDTTFREGSVVATMRVGVDEVAAVEALFRSCICLVFKGNELCPALENGPPCDRTTTATTLAVELVEPTGKIELTPGGDDSASASGASSGGDGSDDTSGSGDARNTSAATNASIVIALVLCVLLLLIVLVIVLQRRRKAVLEYVEEAERGSSMPSAAGTASPTFRSLLPGIRRSSDEHIYEPAPSGGKKTDDYEELPYAFVGSGEAEDAEATYSYEPATPRPIPGQMPLYAAGDNSNALGSSSPQGDEAPSYVLGAACTVNGPVDYANNPTVNVAEYDYCDGGAAVVAEPTEPLYGVADASSSEPLYGQADGLEPGNTEMLYDLGTQANRLGSGSAEILYDIGNHTDGLEPGTVDTVYDVGGSGAEASWAVSGYLNHPSSVDQEPTYALSEPTVAVPVEYEYTDCNPTYELGNPTTLRRSVDNVDGLYLEPTVSVDEQANTLRRSSNEGSAETLRRPSIVIDSDNATVRLKSVRRTNPLFWDANPTTGEAVVTEPV